MKSLAQLAFNPFLALISGRNTRFERPGLSLMLYQIGKNSNQINYVNVIKQSEKYLKIVFSLLGKPKVNIVMKGLKNEKIKCSQVEAKAHQNGTYVAFQDNLNVISNMKTGQPENSFHFYM